MPNVYEVAVLGKQFPALLNEGKTHTFSFNVKITSADFKSVFINKEVFNIIKSAPYTKIDKIAVDNLRISAISAVAEYSAYDFSEEFILREAILSCAQYDMTALTSSDVSFTPISLIKWTKEVNNINDLSQLSIIEALRFRDITTLPGDILNVTSVFTSSNCDILPVKLVMSYLIVEP